MDLTKLSVIEDELGTPAAGKRDDLAIESLLLFYEFANTPSERSHIEELVRRGHIENTDFTQVVDLARCIPKKISNIYFRTSNENVENLRATAAFQLWLGVIASRGELAKRNENLVTYERIDNDYLRNIAKLSCDVESIRQVRDVLAKDGIILVYEPGLSGMKTDGLFITLNDGRPLIALTLRYGRIDYFWFTLLHELAHLALHYNPEGTFFDDDTEAGSLSREEVQADRLAMDSIIDRSLWRRSLAYKRQDEQSVRKTAREVGVHPALIAGRLRKELNAYHLFSDLVHEVDVRDFLYG